MKIKLDQGAFLPESAHDADAGYDLRSRSDEVVPAGGSTLFDTGVHIAIPDGYVGFLKSKSGLNVKQGITSEGVIDSGYSGSIMVKLYNNSRTPYTVHIGDKISQIVFLPIHKEPFEIVDSLDETERGCNGFGSTGK